MLPLRLCGTRPTTFRGTSSNDPSSIGPSHARKLCGESSGEKAMKVLMATDGSRPATRALTTACRILSTQDREIDLLCVAPPVGVKEHVHRAKLCRRAA